ncbi:MAG: hypothetical protein U0414_12215 [Polyangiaceae bacterium]
MQPIARCRAVADGSSTAPCSQSSFRITRVTLQPTCKPGQSWYVHDEWGFTGVGLDRALASRSFLRVDRTAVPLQRLVAPGFEDPAGTISALAHRPATTFEWTTADFAAASKSDASTLRVVRSEGSFEEVAPDAFAFVARATLEGEVDAIALVPGEIYAYRMCVQNCGSPLGDPVRVERVALITPPAGWVGASDVAVESTLADEQPFTHVWANVTAGASASLVVDYPARHPTKHETFGAAAVVTSAVMLDVVWADGDAPVGTLQLGSFDTPIGTLGSRQVSTRNHTDDCYTPPPARPIPVGF